MKRRVRRTISAGAILILVCAGLLVFLQMRQERRERELRGWLVDFHRTVAAEQWKVAKARTEGRLTTEDIPTLVKWISDGSEEALWWQRARAKGYQLLRPMEEPPEMPWDMQLAALFGFAVLGSNATAAIPEVRAFNSSPGLYEKNALVNIGEDSWK